jgi:hypothetical protein
MDMEIRTESLHMANCQLLIEVLAFQNVIIEMLMMRENKYTPDEINSIQRTHIDRIRKYIFTEFGSTRDITQPNSQNT